MAPPVVVLYYGQARYVRSGRGVLSVQDRLRRIPHVNHFVLWSPDPGRTDSSTDWQEGVTTHSEIEESLAMHAPGSFTHFMEPVDARSRALEFQELLDRRFGYGAARREQTVADVYQNLALQNAVRILEEVCPDLDDSLVLLTRTDAIIHSLRLPNETEAALVSAIHPRFPDGSMFIRGDHRHFLKVPWPTLVDNFPSPHAEAYRFASFRHTYPFSRLVYSDQFYFQLDRGQNAALRVWRRYRLCREARKYRDPKTWQYV